MRLSTHVGYGDGFLKRAGQIVKLEEVGLDVVWMAEVYGSDAATRLGFLAARTHRIELGAAIFPIYSRTPARDAQCPIQSAGARSRSTPRHWTILSAAGKDGLGPRDLAPLLRAEAFGLLGHDPLNPSPSNSLGESGSRGG